MLKDKLPLFELEDTHELIGTRHNYYALMTFQTPQELSLDTNNIVPLNTNNCFFRNGVEALKAFLYEPNQNKYLATGETPEELKKDMIKITKEYVIHNN